MSSRQLLLADLLPQRRAVYWADLLLSASIGWLALAFACIAHSIGISAICAVISTLALYRALYFIHEISHSPKRGLPYFELVWNLLIGFPMLVPSFMYVGVHLDHHRSYTYGTSSDPEYLPLAHTSRWSVVMFLLQATLFPILLPIRFLVLAPLSLLFPSLRSWLQRRASTLGINPQYVRARLSERDRAVMLRQELAIVALWSGILALVTTGRLPLRWLGVWVLVQVGIAWLNQIRTLVAHAYESDGRNLSFAEQLQDSHTLPGGLLTELWAPLGARYHALHHYLPKLPYHSLPEAHRRLVARRAEFAAYSQVPKHSLLSALWSIWLRAAQSKSRESGTRLSAKAAP